MINKIKNLDISYKDFIPALSGLIGKIALVSSFALVWVHELSISNPNFVLENIRIEILIGSIITLIVSLLYSNVAPAGTLAPWLIKSHSKHNQCGESDFLYCIFNTVNVN